MKYNENEYMTVKKHVTKTIAETYCLNDACAEIVFPAYEELYDDDVDDDTYYERMDRLTTYAIDMLQELDPTIVRDGALAHREMELFEPIRHDAWAYYQRKGDVDARVIVAWALGCYAACEYGMYGEPTHYGTGKTPQEALYNMRLIFEG